MITNRVLLLIVVRGKMRRVVARRPMRGFNEEHIDED
jgi:hypothetical protein